MLEESPETVNISVAVSKEGGSAVNDAIVKLTKNGEEYTGTTGSKGGCTIKNVPVGQYNVSIDYTSGDTTYSIATVNGASSSSFEVSTTNTSLNIVIQ